jgi:hypothetical protein
MCSRGVLQPSGIRRAGNGARLLSPRRPVLSNYDPLMELPWKCPYFTEPPSREDWI